MTEDTAPENLPEFRKNLRKFMKDDSAVAVDEKTLAGAAIWYDFNTKERETISKKLPIEPKEMVAKYWMKQKAKDIAIDSKDLNLPKKIKDYYYLEGAHLELCKKKMTCRGCQKAMIKGELRLSLGYNGFTMVGTNHYFCRKCVTNFVKPSVRYKLIEKWWETNGWIRLSEALEKKDADYLIKMLDDRKRKEYVWGRNPKEGKWLGFSEYILQTSTPEEIENEIIEKLGNLGDKKALSPIIEIIDENDLDIVAASLSKILKKNKLENSKEILKFLKSNDEGMKRMGVSMLKGILD